MTLRSRPRILYVSPPQATLSIRSLHIARALRQVGDVEIVLVDSLCEGIPASELLAEEFYCVEALGVDREPNGLLRRMRRSVDPRCPLPHGIGVSAGGERRLWQVMPSYDLVWVFKLRTANAFRFWRWPNTVLDVDDLPSGVYETVARSDRARSQRLRAWIEMLNWRRRDRLLSERFSVLTVCSESDARRLDLEIPVHVVPNGAEGRRHPLERRPSVPARIGFIGLLNYEPNLEGVRWFIQHCWPRITARVPGVRFRLVGRGCEGRFGSARPGIDVLGWVPDADSEIATWSVMVVPLFVGGGTRVKVAEGFSRKCPIVSTSTGVYGYDVQPGREILMADDAAGFADACVALLRDPLRGIDMAQRAHEKYLHEWTWDAIAPRVWEAAEDSLRTRGIGTQFA